MFDVERFKAAARIFITAQEIIVDNASYPIKEIAENSHIFRTLGLGYANLGSLIMSYGYGYDSVEGRAICGAITSIMTGEAYEQSARSRGQWDRSPAIATRGAAACQAGREEQCRINAGSDRPPSLRREEIPDDEEFAYLKKEAARFWDARGGARASARLSQRAGHGSRADGND